MTTTFDVDARIPPGGELAPVHFLGIGGIGMSGIARIMLARGLEVSGSDAKDVPVMAALRAVGARAEVGFDPTRLDGVSTVVASSAIRRTTSSWSGPGERHDGAAPVAGAAVADAGHRAVAVAGTNGKTTTSSMLTVLLQRRASTRPSRSAASWWARAPTGTRAREVFVAEADESDSSFLVYTPEVSVVTNVQADHLDHYGTAEKVVEAFEPFADRLGDEGTLVACADDPGSAALARRGDALGRRC